MKRNSSQENALQEFCALILCGHQEEVFCRCKECMEKASNEMDGMESVLYVLSGMDVDESDPYKNVADEDKQLVAPQHYLISTDAGAPELEDFYWFVENIKTARGQSFPINKEKFSDDSSIVEWLEELSQQLEDLYLIHFGGRSEDFHFTILNQRDCERANQLFKRLTGDEAFLISKDSNE